MGRHGNVVHNDPSMYESSDTKYTLRVLCPELPQVKRAPKQLSLGKSPAQRGKMDLNIAGFKKAHLKKMPKKIITIRADKFPLELRCGHLNKPGVFTCLEGCYVLETGGKQQPDKCGNRAGCEGHVYTDHTRHIWEKDKKGRTSLRSCFGSKGQRMVCIWNV